MLFAGKLMQAAMDETVSKAAATTGFSNYEMLLVLVASFAAWRIAEWYYIGKKGKGDKAQVSNIMLSLEHQVKDVGQGLKDMESLLHKMERSCSVYKEEAEAIMKMATLMDIFKDEIFTIHRDVEILKSRFLGGSNGNR